jgi:hypothetical protein
MVRVGVVEDESLTASDSHLSLFTDVIGLARAAIFAGLPSDQFNAVTIRFSSICVWGRVP